MVICVTGGIASGKSRVCAILRDVYGARLISTDDVSRAQTQKGGAVFESIVDTFGSEVLGDDGEIDRKSLARIVFADAALLRRLNDITHPPVRAYIKDEIDRFKASNESGLLVIETALPREADAKAWCDEIWFVASDAQTRIRRLMSDRGYSEAQATQRLDSQYTDEDYTGLADWVMDNRDGVSDEEIIRDICSKTQRLHA